MDAFINKAKQFAIKAHEGKFRRGSSMVPYFYHCEQVYNLVRLYSELYTHLIPAYLHDTIEDKCTTEEEIEKQFGKNYLQYVLNLTKKENQSYEEYLLNIVPEMIPVKIADIVANLSDCPTEKQKQKYYKALMLLQNKKG